MRTRITSLAAGAAPARAPGAFRTRLAHLAIVALVAAALAAAPAAATNGMVLVGYGPETIGRAGANLAIADRSLALNFNPAGIVQLQGNHLAASLSTLAPSLELENGMNASTDAETRYFPLPTLTWVRGGNETRWSYGLGFVAQGGMGAAFDEVNTPFGTRDCTYSEVRFATLTPTVAYSFSDDHAVGATLNVGWADASFEFFPQTSFFFAPNPAYRFAGVDLERAGGLQTNLRLGWWWRPLPALAVGAVYQTETESDYEDGDMTVNFLGFPGLGRKVRYTADIDGFTFPAQAGLGVALRPAHDWVIAFDVKRNYWSDAMRTVTVTARDPDLQGAPPEVVMPFVFDWRDQWVYALGADWRASERLTLRAGYNYGENPVPAGTLTPLFPATTERHATVGASWLVGGRLVELAVERAFPSEQTNDNPNPMVNPFGPGATVRHEQWTVSFGVSWAWSRR